MPKEINWNQGYKQGIANAIAAVERLNIDPKIKTNIRHKIKKCLISINASEPKKQLHEIDVDVEADADG